MELRGRSRSVGTFILLIYLHSVLSHSIGSCFCSLKRILKKHIFSETAWKKHVWIHCLLYTRLSQTAILEKVRKNDRPRENKKLSGKRVEKLCVRFWVVCVSDSTCLQLTSVTQVGFFSHIRLPTNQPKDQEKIPYLEPWKRRNDGAEARLEKPAM